MNFYEAFHYLEKHPAGDFIYALNIEVVRVNPETKFIDTDKSKNTLVQVWLETGPKHGTHDFCLNCGGDTFEEAIIALADRVRLFYDEGYTENLVP